MRVAFGGAEFPCRAVAFDKDGTLFDSHHYWGVVERLRARALADLAGEAIVPRWRKSIGVGWHGDRLVIDVAGPYAVGSVLEETILTATVLYQEGYGSWERCREVAQGVFGRAADHLRPEEAFLPLDGARETLRALQAAGLPVGVVTSDNRRPAEQALGLLAPVQVDFLVAADDVQRAKPFPDLMLRAAEVTGVAPEAFVVVGDSMMDLLLAKSVGAKAVAIVHRHLYSPEHVAGLEAAADAVVDSLRQIRVVD